MIDARGLPPIRLDLRGECNRCGLCCVVEHPTHGTLVCEHLRVTVPVQPLGHPLSTRCGVYAQRVSGMVIHMRDGAGVGRQLARCFKDTWQEDHVILARGIGRGCSLTLPVAEGQLVAFTPAKGA